MIKKYFRMFFVFSFSCVILLMFLTVSGILQVQGAVGGPEEAMIEKRQSGVQAPLQDADIELIVLDDPDPVIAGNPLTYTLIVTNNGPSPAINVTLVDDYPQQKLDFISVTPEPDCGRQGNDLVCAFGDLAVGESREVTLLMGVKVAAANPLNNPVEVFTDSNDPTPGNNQETETTTIIYSSDMSVTTFDDPDPVDPGGTLNYTLTIHNGGPSQANSVLVNDTLPDELTLVSITPSQGTCNGTTCSLGTLAPGGSAYVNLVTTVDLSASGVITNTAQVSSQAADPVPGNNTDYETTAIGAGADLLVTKSGSPDPVPAGGLLTYTVTANNLGPSEATDVVLVDTLPVGVSFISSTPGAPTCSNVSGSVTCSLGALSSGTTIDVTIVVLVDQAAIGPLVNEADISTTTYDPSPINNHVIESTTVIYSSDLLVTTVDDPDPTDPGETLTYILTIDNTGPSNADSVIVTDTLPAEVSLVSITPSQGSCAGTVCTLGTILSGSTANVTLVSTVSLGASGVITNTAQVSSDEPDPSPGNNLDYEITTIGEGVDLSISMSDTPDPVTAGELLVYVMTVTNLSSTDASNVVLADTLPNEVTFISSTPGAPTCVFASGSVTCNFGALSAGASTDVSIVLQVDPGAGGPLTNQANVSSVTFDPDLSNNQATEDTAINYSSDLSISTVDYPDPVNPGGVLSYTLTIINSGPSDVSGVVVTDTLPADVSLLSITPSQGTCAGTVCDLGTILAGAQASINLETTVDMGAVGDIVNTAQVSATDDPDPSNNTDFESTSIDLIADLSISKSDFPDPVIPGGLLTYTLNINNHGPLSATNVTVTDTLPVVVNLVSINPSQGTCVGTICDLGTILANNSANVILVTAVDEGAAGLITNSAQVSGLETDPMPDNNLDIEMTVVGEGFDVADLSITKDDFPDPVAPGKLLTYTLTVVNNGPDSATNVTITDSLPAQVAFVMSQPELVCSENDGLVSCGPWTLVAFESTAVNIVVVVNPTAVGPLVNQAHVSSDVIDPDAYNNIANASTNVIAAADLSVSTSDDPEPANPGDMLTYVINVTNNGPYLTSGVTLIDNLPDEVTLLDSEPSQGECVGTICSLGNLAVGDSAQVTLVGLVALDASGVITNTAEAYGQLLDPILENNVDQEFTTIGPGADLSLTQSDSPDPVVAGEILTYSLTVQNLGPSDASGVILLDTLPGNVVFLSSNPGAPTCTQSAGTVLCDLGGIASNQASNVDIVVRINATATGVLVNQAQVSSITFDSDETNNSAAEETTIMPPDTAPPTVEWILPVEDEQTFYVGAEILTLEAGASDDIAVQRVDFFWWDPVIAQFIDIGSVYSAPYRIDFDTSVLYPGYNQVYVRAYDNSGNASNRPRILLYRQELQYLPLVTR